MNFSITSVKDSIKSSVAKIAEKGVLTKNKERGPQLEVVKDVFVKDISKLIYLFTYFLYHGIIRIFTLWTIYGWLTNL